MKFITDANIPKSLVKRLSSEGYDIVDIRDFLPDDSPDSEVYSETLKQNRTIISRDKHFGNILIYPPQQHFGVIILRTKGLNSEALTETLINFIMKIGDDDYSGKIYIIENNKYRKRDANQ